MSATPSLSFADALHQRPRPLYLHTDELLVVWTPKAACTQVVMWYLHLAGLLDAALFYSQWPHQFRQHVLYESATFKRWLAECDPTRVRTIQFVRDPVKRCVSSYRQYLRYGMWDKTVSSALGREVSCRTGYSFNAFLDYLERINVARAKDPHVGLQRHPVTRHVAPEIIRLDEQDMFAEMNRVERELGRPPTDFDALAAFARVRASHHARHDRAKRASEDDQLDMSHAREFWPLHAEDLRPETLARVKRIYQADMAYIYGGDVASGR